MLLRRLPPDFLLFPSQILMFYHPFAGATPRKIGKYFLLEWWQLTFFFWGLLYICIYPNITCDKGNVICIPNHFCEHSRSQSDLMKWVGFIQPSAEMVNLLGFVTCGKYTVRVDGMGMGRGHVKMRRHLCEECDEDSAGGTQLTYGWKRLVFLTGLGNWGLKWTGPDQASSNGVKHDVPTIKTVDPLFNAGEHS